MRRLVFVWSCGCNCGCTLLNMDNVSSICNGFSVRSERARLRTPWLLRLVRCAIRTRQVRGFAEPSWPVLQSRCAA